jgi:hypothetical protein
MPTYSFKHKETGDITIRIMKMSELDEYKASNPELETYIESSMVVKSLNIKGILSGNNTGFKEVLQRIHERTPGSCLDRSTNI